MTKDQAYNKFKQTLSELNLNADQYEAILRAYCEANGY